jgi:hypothetical protein
MTGSHDPRVLEALFRVESMSADMAEIKVAMRDMAAAIGKLAVIEERQTQANAAIERTFRVMDKHDERIRTLEEAQPLQKQAADWVGRVVAIVLTAFVTAMAGYVFVGKSEAPHAPAAVTQKG